MNLINYIAEKTGKWISWINLLLIILVCADVLSRTIFKFTQSWVMELEWHFFALLFILGGMITYKHDGHVRVDIFYSRYSEKQKAWVDLLGSVFLLLPWISVVVVTSWKFAMNSFERMEGSPNPGGLPYLFIIKFVIVLGFVLLAFQALKVIGDSITIIMNK